MANDYASVEDLFEIVGLDPEKYSTIMQFMLDSAAKHIDNVTKRKKNGWLADTVATTRLFVGSGNEIINIDENVSVTAVGFKHNYDDASFTPMIASDYIAFAGTKDNPDFNKTPYTMLMIDPNGDFDYFPHVTSFGATLRESTRLPSYPSVQVTAKWGYALEVPDIIKTCVVIQATRYVKRAQAVFGDAIGNLDTGQILYVRKMDNDIASLLKDGGMIRVGV